MNEFKLVPVEPTEEMATAAMNEEIYANRFYGEPAAFSDIWRAMLAAAPAVQGEPVGEVRLELGSPSYIFAELYSKSLSVLTPGTKLYAAPQPAEQQPLTSSLAYDASIHLTNWLNMNLCECEGGHTCGYNEVRRTRDALLAVAEKKQDITQLVEALELARNDLSDWITSFPEAAHTHTRIVIARIDAAMAPYRKGRSDVE